VAASRNSSLIASHHGPAASRTCGAHLRPAATMTVRSTRTAARRTPRSLSMTRRLKVKSHAGRNAAAWASLWRSHSVRSAWRDLSFVVASRFIVRFRHWVTSGSALSSTLAGEGLPKLAADAAGDGAPNAEPELEPKLHDLRL
jgi:hypothetical protein